MLILTLSCVLNFVRSSQWTGQPHYQEQICELYLLLVFFSQISKLKTAFPTCWLSR